MSLKFIPQHDQMDCGPACLAMIAKKYGKNYPLQYLRGNSFLTKEGVSIAGIKEAAKKIGFDSFTYQLGINELRQQGDEFPCIIHWNQNHFIVLDRISTGIFSRKTQYHVADPSYGLLKVPEERFKQSWCSRDNEGIALFLKPTEKFYNQVPPVEEQISIKRALSYLKPHKRKVIILTIMLLTGSLISLVFPFLTQNLIDKGVTAKDLNVIMIILLAQLALYIGSITIEVIRNWFTLYIGTKISITIISDYLMRILSLPLKFFDTKMMGDFNQRIQDNERIEQFLTSQSLTTFFSLITFAVFFGVLWFYNTIIMVTYLALTTISLIWSLYWLKKRKTLDYFRFLYRGESQEGIYEIVNGVTELKLNQFEDFKRKEWENIQDKLFKVNIRLLKVNQLQLSGFEFVNQIKNILVTFLAASLVVKGEITLGALLSISYIIGQLNAPVNYLVAFIRSFQDAKLSLERLNEVHVQQREENENQREMSVSGEPEAATDNGIDVKNLFFQYAGPISPLVLKDLSFKIPEGKVTAIVGASGSGKTTLMKLLLRFYAPTDGHILYNNDDLNDLSPKSVRSNCGVVMQDGFIFSDTIERNIVAGDQNIDRQRLSNAVKTANIEDFIDNLPLGYETKIGASGNGISGGQKQRILIARAVYKNPHYIFFDEATSALDADNEMIIHNNLQSFFKGKTVVIIAHRLSTVKKADQIIVLKEGRIVESGSHQELVYSKSDYYKLVKNQLELGN